MSKGIFLVVLSIIILVITDYLKKEEDKKEEKKSALDFYKELDIDMDKYDIPEVDQEQILSLIKKTIDKKDNKKTLKDYIKTSRSGLIRGCVIGYVLGDYQFYTGLYSGTVYAILNPLLMYLDC
jgi:hypothetical protein